MPLLKKFYWESKLNAKILLFLIAWACTTASAQGPQAIVKDIIDVRATGKIASRSERLKVELDIAGIDLSTARGRRALLVTKATDNTGRSLIKKTAGNPLHPFHYVALDSVFWKIELSLLSPSRDASAIQELHGEAQFHFPQRDPASVVTVPSLYRRLGKPIRELSLKGVKLTVSDQAPANGIDVRSMDPKTQHIWFSLEDPQSIIVDLELTDGKGQKLETYGRTLVNHIDYTVTLPGPLQPDAQLIIYLATPKSIMSVPLKISGIALP